MYINQPPPPYRPYIPGAFGEAPAADSSLAPPVQMQTAEDFYYWSDVWRNVRMVGLGVAGAFLLYSSYKSIDEGGSSGDSSILPRFIRNRFRR